VFAVEPAYTRPLGGSKLAVTDDPTRSRGRRVAERDRDDYRPAATGLKLIVQNRAACAYNPTWLETGRHDPALTMIEKLAKALKVRVEELRK
jgi:hypothetical protein